MERWHTAEFILSTRTKYFRPCSKYTERSRSANLTTATPDNFQEQSPKWYQNPILYMNFDFAFQM